MQGRNAARRRLRGGKPEREAGYGLDPGTKVSRRNRFVCVTGICSDLWACCLVVVSAYVGS
jgi:hypothetical protein